VAIKIFARLCHVGKQKQEAWGKEGGIFRGAGGVADGGKFAVE